jgi:hypothetical protein
VPRTSWVLHRVLSYVFSDIEKTLDYQNAPEGIGGADLNERSEHAMTQIINNEPALVGIARNLRLMFPKTERAGPSGDQRAGNWLSRPGSIEKSKRVRFEASSELARA